MVPLSGMGVYPETCDCQQKCEPVARKTEPPPTGKVAAPGEKFCWAFSNDANRHGFLSGKSIFIINKMSI